MCSSDLSGKTKAAVIDKLRDLHAQLDKGITPRRATPTTPSAARSGTRSALNLCWHRERAEPPLTGMFSS